MTTSEESDLHPFMTVVEIAALMRVSRATVYRLLHDHRLPRMRVGKLMRVPRQAVLDFMRDAYLDDPPPHPEPPTPALRGVRDEREAEDPRATGPL